MAVSNKEHTPHYNHHYSTTHKETHGVRNVVFRFPQVSDSHFFRGRLFFHEIIALSSVLFHQTVLFHGGLHRGLYSGPERRGDDDDDFVS